MCSQQWEQRSIRGKKKGKEGDETQFTTKIAGKTSLGPPSYFVSFLK